MRLFSSMAAEIPGVGGWVPSEIYLELELEELEEKWTHKERQLGQ